MAGSATSVLSQHCIMPLYCERRYLDCGSGSFLDGGRSWCDPFKSWEAVYAVEPSEAVAPEHLDLILGGEVCLWAEQVDESNVHSKLWPRAAAFAERMWSTRETEDLPDARRHLSLMVDRLRRRGVQAAPIHPKFCVLHPGSCNSNSGSKHFTSWGITEFPSSASRTFQESLSSSPTA
mmetsp:Transcript_2155/g.3460  ORF Transcript_2155/g.3460 Transcript_2155/m.3460 type:complete len:178 (+) Transcript_2155:704-1237(+)